MKDLQTWEARHESFGRMQSKLTVRTSFYVMNASLSYELVHKQEF